MILIRILLLHFFSFSFLGKYHILHAFHISCPIFVNMLIKTNNKYRYTWDSAFFFIGAITQTYWRSDYEKLLILILLLLVFLLLLLLLLLCMVYFTVKNYIMWVVKEGMLEMDSPESSGSRSTTWFHWRCCMTSLISCINNPSALTPTTPTTPTAAITARHHAITSLNILINTCTYDLG